MPLTLRSSVVLAATAAPAVVRPEPGPARRWLENELSRPEYNQESLLERFLGWLADVWDAVTRQAAGAGALSAPLAVLLLLVLVALGVWVATRVRREPTVPAGARAVLGGEALTAEVLRERAELARSEGRHDDAVIEGTRAIATRMAGRGLVTVTPGTTAHEIAVQLGEPFPDRSGRLLEMAGAFELVLYGGGHVSVDDVRRVLDLDDELDAAMPRRHEPQTTSSGRAPL